MNRQPENWKWKARRKGIALAAAALIGLPYIVSGRAMRQRPAKEGAANSAQSAPRAGVFASSAQTGTTTAIVSTPVVGASGTFAGTTNNVVRMPGSGKSAQQNSYADAKPAPSVMRDPLTSSTSLRKGRSGSASTLPAPASKAVSPYLSTSLSGPGRQTGVPPTQLDSMQALPSGKSPLDDVSLAGVIAGPYSVAVLHIGSRSYELVGGEKLPYGLTLTQITDRGVALRQGTRTVFLEIGKTLRAALPVKPDGRLLPPAKGALSAATFDTFRGEVTLERTAPTPPPLRELAAQ